jgi:hypothetical protein
MHSDRFLLSVCGAAALWGTASCTVFAMSDSALTSGAQDGDAGDAGDAARDGTPTSCSNAVQCGSGVCCQAGCNAGECASCSLNGSPCRSDSACCSGSCNGEGRCQEACSDSCGQTSCAPSGGDCAQPRDCCAGTCIGGSCGACLALGASCRLDTDCCTLVCGAEGVCSPCLPSGSPSGDAGGAHCCSGHTRGTSCR